MGNFNYSFNRKLKCFANKSSTAICCGTTNSNKSENIKSGVKNNIELAAQVLELQYLQILNK